MLHGDAVDVAREAQRDVGHVHQAVVDASGTLNSGGAVMTEHLVHLVQAELVVPGRNRRVRRKHALAPHRLHVGLRGVRERAGIQIAQLLLEQRNREQRRVTLVHVVDSGFAAKRLHQVDPTETKNRLLAEAVKGVAPVEMVGQPAIPRIVSFHVRVQKKHGHHMPGHADHVKAPRAHQHLPAIHSHSHSLACARQQRLR